MDILTEKWDAFVAWWCRKWCRHPVPYEYEEIRLQRFDEVSWTAMFCCKKCGEVMAVEASFSGNRYRLAEAISAEVGGSARHDGDQGAKP